MKITVVNSFGDDRAALSALRYVKDEMRPYELDALRLADAMTRRCQAVLELRVKSTAAAPLDAVQIRAVITGE